MRASDKELVIVLEQQWPLRRVYIVSSIDDLISETLTKLRGDRLGLDGEISGLL